MSGADRPVAYLHREPCRDPEILLALRWLVERLDETGGQILVLAPGRDNLGYTDAFNPSRRELCFETQRTLRGSRWRGGPALALWPSPRMVAMLDDHHGVTAIAAVPWSLTDIEDWRRAWQPVDLLGEADPVQAAVPADPVVLVALEHLTRMVNLGTGITHPSDKSQTIGAFKLLRAGGHGWDPDIVYSWAVANGWSHRGADSLREVARKVANGQNPRSTQFEPGEDSLENWRQEAEQR